MRKAGTHIVAAIVLFGMTGQVYAGYADAVRKGNKAFAEKDFATALDKYREAEADRPTSPEIDYNLGGALFEQGKYEEAVERFTHALNTTDPRLAASAQFNLGNTHYRMQDYLKAIQAYEESLKLNPKDVDAKFNLELARKMLKENAKGENQKQNNQQQQDQQQQQQQQKDQQDKDDKDKQQQQQPSDQQDQNKDQQKQDQQQAQAKDQKKMSKEDAERILNALRDNEKDTQKKLKRQLQTNGYNGKDW